VFQKLDQGCEVGRSGIEHVEMFIIRHIRGFEDQAFPACALRVHGLVMCGTPMFTIHAGLRFCVAVFPGHGQQAVDEASHAGFAIVNGKAQTRTQGMGDQYLVFAVADPHVRYADDDFHGFGGPGFRQGVGDRSVRRHLTGTTPENKDPFWPAAAPDLRPVHQHLDQEEEAAHEHQEKDHVVDMYLFLHRTARAGMRRFPRRQVGFRAKRRPFVFEVVPVLVLEQEPVAIDEKT
jgi:hypothetical protein